MQKLLFIDGVELPPAKAYTVTLQDLDGSSSGRGETGVMFRNRVRAGIYKLQLSFRLNMAELLKVSSAISAESFSVRFFDPTTAQAKTCTMYCGDRTGSMVLNSEDPAQTLWDFSFNLIEI